MVECPRCHHVFDDEARAPDGEGDQSALKLKVLAGNLAVLARFFLDHPGGFTIHQLSYALALNHVERHGRRPGGGWNYHDCQATTSKLLALKLVSVIGVDHGKPVYCVNPTRVAEVLNNGGRL